MGDNDNSISVVSLKGRHLSGCPRAAHISTNVTPLPQESAGRRIRWPERWPMTNMGKPPCGGVHLVGGNQKSDRKIKPSSKVREGGWEQQWKGEQFDTAQGRTAWWSYSRRGCRDAMVFHTHSGRALFQQGGGGGGFGRRRQRDHPAASCTLSRRCCGSNGGGRIGGM